MTTTEAPTTATTTSGTTGLTTASTRVNETTARASLETDGVVDRVAVRFDTEVDGTLTVVENTPDRVESPPAGADQVVALLSFELSGTANVTGAVVQVEIDRATIPDSVQLENLSVYHRTDDDWNRLETTVTAAENGTAVVSAPTGTFSRFVVADDGRKSDGSAGADRVTPIESPRTAEPEPDARNSAPETVSPMESVIATLSTSVPWTWAFLAVVATLVGLLVLARRPT